MAPEHDPADNHDEDEMNHAAPMLQEVLGVTPAGTCVRHPNCPVLSLAHNKVMSCRVCFSEEKSSGIRQRKSFAAVVQQLQRMSTDEEEKTPDHCEDKEHRRQIQRAHSANMQALILQQPQTMDSIMKRMTQVQNWVLRQKEKEVLSLQLQIQRLEERLYESETQTREQKQTIWALRRTIQQDMKLIKTMAVQKERELESGDMLSPDSNSYASPRGRAPQSAASSTESTPQSVNESPLRRGGGANVVNMKKVRSQLEKVKKLSASNHSGVVPAYFQGDDDDDDDEDNSAKDPHDRRSSYWDDAKYSKLASDPSKLFASFRGGLLDIPKSPPAPHHDKKNRNKLQLDTIQMQQLTVPRIRGVHRAISDDGSTHSALSADMSGRPLSMLAANVRSLPFAPPPATEAPTPGGAQSQIQSDVHAEMQNSKQPIRSMSSDYLEATAEVEEESEQGQETSYRSILTSTYSIATMTSTRHASKHGHTEALTEHTTDANANAEEEDSDDDEDKTGNGTEEDDKTVDTTPTFYGDSKMLSEIDGPIAEEMEDSAKKESTEVDFLFPVTGASCQDKYGDTGMYTGTILVTEGMPHGKGTMNYESGRMYSGDWVCGQWHGKGKLLNANGDTYEGDFVYDARHGKGVYKWDNGDIYTGDFRLDKREGQGRFCFHNGNVYEGEFTDGVFEGFGKYTFEDGYYEGEWKDGRYHGDGELQYSGGGKYVGEFRESLANGFGMEILQDGTKRRGVWDRGQPIEIFDKV